MKKIGLFVIPIKVDDSISTYNDYLDFLVKAEQSGYTNVYVGEHLTDPKEDIQSSIVFASALLARTKSLKVCLCVLPLPHYEIKLLIKQLEDLYRLSKGRLQIGFSQGALKSDAEYLGFEHSKRADLFSSKIKDFMKGIEDSKFLKEISKNDFCSTLLSPIPLKSSNLFLNGYSAITSNFVNELYWENHIKCLTKNNSYLNTLSKWHICMNLIPSETMSSRSYSSIKKSLFYIYQKLILCNLNVMIPENKNKFLKEDDLHEVLFKNITYTNIPEKYIQLTSKYKNILGHPIVNLFDCINDSCYCDFILGLPRYGRFTK